MLLVHHTRYLSFLLPFLAAAATAQASDDPAAAGSPSRSFVGDDAGTTAWKDWHDVRFERVHGKRALGKAWTGSSTLARAGVSGVAAMQMSVIDDDHVLIYDKAENNALLAKNGKSAWGSIYRISDQSVRALNLQTNSFCAGGGWLSNGTLVSVGGNPQQTYMNDAAGDGLAAVRLFTPCDDDKCDVYENPDRLRLTSARWYPSTVRLQDGSIMILGGMIAGGFNNAESTDNPTFEFFPPKGDGLQIYSKFLHDALNSNLFPITYLLPSGHIFVAANKIAMIYNWKTKQEVRRLPGIPNGVTVTYPASAANVLLPLTVQNGWTPEIMIFGGTPPSVNLDGNPAKLSSSAPASKQCIRMVLTSAGIKKGWQVESMPEARIMGDAILTPDMKVFLVNGAQSGIAGYGNVPDTVGASNARNPALRPTLYDPVATAGKRFTTNFPSSNIERLYHSSATLVPDGRILFTGSNPNDKVSKKTYMTRFEVEMFSPPYTKLVRPRFLNAPARLLYDTTYTITINVLSSAKAVQAVIMDLGYSTHGVHMNNRLVELETVRSSKTKLTIKGPKNAALYPPGYAWLYILGDGVPSLGKRIMVGSGANPPSSAYASNNLLAKTKP